MTLSPVDKALDTLKSMRNAPVTICHQCALTEPEFVPPMSDEEFLFRIKNMIDDKGGFDASDGRIV